MADYNFNPLQMALKPLLEKAMAEDSLFASQVSRKGIEGKKSFAECCDYIMGEAYAYAKEHKQDNLGLAGCDDGQIVSMIKHYYDEDNIEIKKVGGATAKVAKVEKKPEPPKPKPAPEPSLFDLL